MILKCGRMQWSVEGYLLPRPRLDGLSVRFPAPAVGEDGMLLFGGSRGRGSWNDLGMLLGGSWAAPGRLLGSSWEASRSVLEFSWEPRVQDIYEHDNT